MEEKRKLRYKQKLEFITERLESLPEEQRSDLAKDAIFYRVQVAIDAAMDVVAMLVKDLGREIGDDYHNVEVLTREKVVNKDLGDWLKRLNGMRNAIVHKYNTFEEEEVLGHLEEIKNILFDFLEKTENVIKTLS